MPGAKSSEGLPATVTRPDLLGCRSCRWLPRRVTSVQPSSFNIRRTARTFIHPKWHDGDCSNNSQISAISRNSGIGTFCFLRRRRIKQNVPINMQIYVVTGPSLFHLVLHGIDQLAETLDFDFDGVAVFHPDRWLARITHTGRCARHDNVTGFERHALT